ncbi:unnamed protein product [Closterium sp. NIES-64]|nr:unnamed protein product [Closterium sp. NIES-64]
MCIAGKPNKIQMTDISIPLTSVLARDDVVATGDDSGSQAQQSRTESFLLAVEEGEKRVKELEGKVDAKQRALEQLQADIDKLYSETFAGVEIAPEASRAGEPEGKEEEKEQQPVSAAADDVSPRVFESMDEEAWGNLGRSEPSVLKALIESVDRAAWTAFQREVHSLALRRDRTRQELRALLDQLDEARTAAAAPMEETLSGSDSEAEGPAAVIPGLGAKGERKVASIVLVAGFESFNVALYKQAAAQLRAQCPGIRLSVFSNRDILSKSREMEAALARADVFFGSLIFDYDECEWLQQRIKSIPIRLIFESSLELMAMTTLGSFAMVGGKSQGMPAPVKAVLSKFGGGREEDRMVGYLSFLKVGPKLLRFIPGKRARDLRNWLTVYGYWNQGGLVNVVNMFLYLANEYLLPTGITASAPVETPPLGLYHPDYDGYFTSPSEYLRWFRSSQNLPPSAPVVALLLYRKHVVTQQPYIPRLIRMLQQAGLVPLPIFINGVEAHTVVRDLLTTAYEQEERRKGVIMTSSLSQDAVMVDAVVSTIGFPLVGGPAGSMEGGRQAEVAKSILLAKNVPYVVAAPLLIQDIPSWKRDGVQGLQSVVLYSLPELDGAIDAIPLGGLVGDGIHLVGWGLQSVVLYSLPELDGAIDAIPLGGLVGDGIHLVGWGLQSVVLYSLPELDGAIDAIPLGGLVGDGIHLVPERVRRLTSRLWSWINLRRTARAQRKVALVLYGFPPGVGATGTAALLNVPKSLEALLQRMHAEGYDLGPAGEAITRGEINGEDLIALLQELDADRVVSAGERGPELALKAVNEKLQRNQDGPRSIPAGVVPVAECIDWRQLRDWIGETLTGRMERAWGELRKIRSIHCDSEGRSVVSGIQLGNVWIGVQPVLGLEGDPMRLLFERDLTPHPQYAAFYKWLQQGMQANAVVHFGMHGTVEWLPGSPLGNTGIWGCEQWYGAMRSGLSWSDVLLGNLPNIYIYAANNPSESIVAKRRGYGTIVSYNVPPYGRAGLYKELAGLRELISEFREDPAKNESLKPAIVGALVTAGMQADCPFVPSDGSSGGEPMFLDEESIQGVSEEEFEKYLVKLYEYLAVVENRLFSEGLHNLGRPPKEEQMEQYLSAYFGDDLDDTAIEAVAHTHGDLAEVRQRLEQLYLRDGVAPPARDAEVDARVEEAVSIRQLLARNTEELDNVLRGLDEWFSAVRVDGMDCLDGGSSEQLLARNTEELDNVLRGVGGESRIMRGLRRMVGTGGGLAPAVATMIHSRPRPISALCTRAGDYVPPAVGGDLLRDGPGVLPTGRNIHALDPYRMPSAAAWERGSAIAANIIQQHLDQHGTYPETIAVMLWGLDAIKTRGESVAIALALVGAHPVKEGTGRVVRFDLTPLEQLGRPRIDVLANLSGIFRDSFANVVELLDDLFRRAGEADEPPEMNFIRKHSLALQAEGIDASTARIFSNPAGDYGSMVNERIGAADWFVPPLHPCILALPPTLENGEELGDTWQSRNSFSYGRGEQGVARPEVPCCSSCAVLVLLLMCCSCAAPHVLFLCCSSCAVLVLLLMCCSCAAPHVLFLCCSSCAVLVLLLTCCSCAAPHVLFLCCSSCAVLVLLLMCCSCAAPHVLFLCCSSCAVLVLLLMCCSCAAPHVLFLCCSSCAVLVLLLMCCSCAAPHVMRKLLQTTDRIVQEIDSVEYGLTDIQEYYANTGAMKNAAETARNGAKVSCSVVETYGKDLRPRDLEATLRLEYRSKVGCQVQGGLPRRKLLNPKWAEKMAAQGSGGAYEISQRMTALLGWGGTTGFQEDWVFDQAADTYALDDAMAAKLRKNNPQEDWVFDQAADTYALDDAMAAKLRKNNPQAADTYALDDAMAAKLRKNNPQAFQNILKRMLEAAGRGMWQANDEVIEKLRELYAEMDDELEGVKLR